MIKIKAHVSFSEIGKRSNNEDNYGFIEGATFIVCDGVGGAEKGEIASEIVVESLLSLYKADVFTPAQLAVMKAEQNIGEYMSEHPDSQGMATTLTLLQVRPGGIYLAWVGDSRIYQFRQGQVVYQTRDHSWVNEAVDAGILTPEEAIDHPKGNVITRAIQGNQKPVQVQDKFQPNVQTGDYFMLCSDGVLEAWSDDDLAALFGQANNLEEIQETLKKECDIQSRDNHTAIILQIESGLSVEPSDFVNQKESYAPMMEAIPLSENELNTTVGTPFFKKVKGLLGNKKILIAFSALLILLAFCYAMLKEDQPDSKSTQGTEHPKEDTKKDSE